MRLHEWQRSFQNAVLGAQALPSVPLQEGRIAPSVSIEIYANAYRVRLHEALRSNFPALHQLLGDDDFERMAFGFVAMHPPRTASIRWFGAELPHYLRVTEPFARLPILAELAQFEWALRHTVDAADAERIDVNDLQTLTPAQWEAFTCEAHPSLTILQGQWNAPQVWRALDAGEDPPPPTALDSYWFVYRDVNLLSQWRSANALEAEAIQRWSYGEDFGGICEFFAEKFSDVQIGVNTAATFMRTWVEQGLLVARRDA